MPEKYYLGLDQGTTGTTAVVFDGEFRQLSRSSVEITQHYPDIGFVEHNPEEIYESLLVSGRNAIKTAGINASDISAVGLANQGETVVLWDKKTGKPVYPAIVWQDKRTETAVKELAKKHGEEIRRLSGLFPDTYFGATKIRWILDNVPEAGTLLKEERLLAGPSDSYMIWKLTGGKSFYTDGVTASRTSLMNIKTFKWDSRLLEIFGIPEEILPEIRNSADFYGETVPEAFFGAKIPITGNTVDQQSALTGQGCFSKGSVKTTYGTGCFMLMNTGDKPCFNNDGLLVTPALYIDNKPTFALDGGAYITGAAVQWLRDGLKIIKEPKEADMLAESLSSNGGVYFVPAFSGLAAPYWDAGARGTVVGLTAGTGAAHIARATLESEAYQVKDIFDAMKKASDMPILSMRADGGSTKSRFLMQFQSDILGIPVEIPEVNEATALGTVYLAAKGIGDIKDITSFEGRQPIKTVYHPHMSADERETLLHNWHKAVDRSKGWI